jgi:hypothetical protein
MAYGDGYGPKEYDQVVPEGDYKIKLGIPQDVNKNGWDIREIPIQISGYLDYQPAKWSIFARSRDDDAKAAEWDKHMTKFFDAFGIARGDFNPRSWANKVGMVHIAKDKNGYMQVKWPIVPESGQAPQAAASVKQAPEPASFVDDIPF